MGLKFETTMPRNNLVYRKRKYKNISFFEFANHRLFELFPTSSTAQGGGGSFKNRKPIGELGCCEPGMAERSH